MADPAGAPGGPAAAEPQVQPAQSASPLPGTPGAESTSEPAGTPPGTPEGGASASVATGRESRQPAREEGGSEGFPDEKSTGVTPGTRLTVVEGDQVFARDGEVVEGRDFHGFVEVEAEGVTFRNCVFRGGKTDRTRPLLDTEGGSGTVVQDSEFVPAHPSPRIDGMWTRRTEVVRVNVHGTVDGIKAHTDTLVRDSYIHDLAWFASDPDQDGGPTHNDGVQSFAGESRVTLRHNTIDISDLEKGNAAWQSSAADSSAEDNFFDGGGCTLNFDHTALGKPLDGIRLTNNRFGRHSFFDCPILLSTRSELAKNSGNVWHDTGKPIPSPERHD